jgi:hypothetical protein
MTDAGASQPVLGVLAFLADGQNRESVEGVLMAVGAFYPPALALAAAAPMVQKLAALGLRAIESGLMDGSIIPDGKGGFVPSTNSRYDPATGEFLK